MKKVSFFQFRLISVLFCLPLLCLAADDPVVAKAKQGTRIAVLKTKQGTSATVRAVRTAAEWTSGDPTKPSTEEIAKARKKRLVWADHGDWVYYKDGPNYGRTSLGEFWTEDGAKGAGYKLASVKTAIEVKAAPQNTAKPELAKPEPAN
jgi:hypothetical protein